ncbi:hypothetical protein MKW98_016359 [Papaver atlanticum]|uniref:Protein kinase domain-containing protein n=1 Tax=Papaver atlanticum TaxID=357466 RepID=A0AAD4S1C2_9MAGN|nr:hypothetical protein MKW98_016359 [Papaver atlanticum]
MKDNSGVIQILGFIRHPNFVPLQAFYSWTRGEKLLVHPFLWSWKSCSVSSRGLDHLHTGLHKLVIHGNLKSKNIFLHLILNLKTSQEMLEASADQGYKAPELIKMKDIISGKEPIDDNPPPNQDPYLPNSMRSAIIDHRISDIYISTQFISQPK